MAIDVPGSAGSDAMAGPESGADTRGSSVEAGSTAATGTGTWRRLGGLTGLGARDAGCRSVAAVDGAATAGREVMTTADWRGQK